MHMANELLSLPVALGSLTAAAGTLGWVCRRVQQTLNPERLALTGMLGAFVFAAQMVNIQLPGMPGTSGHLIGAVLLAIILGPHAGALAISAVVMIQCLIFQDGGLLALGCNIINMALVPTYLGYWIYQKITGPRLFQNTPSSARERDIFSSGKDGEAGDIERIVDAAGHSQTEKGPLEARVGFLTQPHTSQRFYLATLLACLITVEISALLVPLQAALSGVLVVPLSVFAGTMLGVHALVGLVEGLITISVLAYLQQVRPATLSLPIPGRARLSQRTLLITLGLATVLIATGLSLLASGLPDGLEWTYAERPDQPEFQPMIAAPDDTTVKIDHLQAKVALMPDYSHPQTEAAGWTSLAGLLGSFLTMALIWITARLLKRRQAPTVVT